jgi:hypothetical protein
MKYQGSESRLTMIEREDLSEIFRISGGDFRFRRMLVVLGFGLGLARGFARGRGGSPAAWIWLKAKCLTEAMFVAP